MKITNETRALAYEILAYWLRFENHDQDSWVGDNRPEVEVVKVGKTTRKVCDTTMCAAGTAVFLTTSTKKFLELSSEHFSDDDEWVRRGAKALGLTEDEANKVFYSDNDTALKYMKAIAAGNQARFDEITENEYESI